MTLREFIEDLEKFAREYPSSEDAQVVVLHRDVAYQIPPQDYQVVENKVINKVCPSIIHHLKPEDGGIKMFLI